MSVLHVLFNQLIICGRWYGIASHSGCALLYMKPKERHLIQWLVVTHCRCSEIMIVAIQPLRRSTGIPGADNTKSRLFGLPN
jgi:hypothetical protein